MSKNHALALLLCAGLLAACAAPPGAATPSEQPATASPTRPDPTATARPRPTKGLETPMTPAPDLAGTPGFEPQPGDSDLMRGLAFLDDAAVVMLDTAQPRVVLTVIGNKPTGCHQLRVAAGRPDAQNRIPVDVYTVVDPTMMCTQVLSPFHADANLGTFPPGAYTLVINGGELEIKVSI